ncbi:hypothetical protein [Leptospira levettii]|uniref:hypothetical protein n=1 Tax=Leptospira levettii TaxID=2023178 RepID=UPI000C2B344B|nr:hypothetical protein [Leptospira levettii]PJZ89529.1 hypothetical protein CH368_06110 [Leptospira levettii]
MIKKIKENLAIAVGFFLTLRLVVFVIFMYQMMVMSYHLFMSKGKIRQGKLDEIMVAHVHPDFLNESVTKINRVQEAIASPYKTLYGTKPVVVLMPFGMTLHAISIVEFFQLLDKDQQRNLKREIQKVKSIEVVSSIREATIG